MRKFPVPSLNKATLACQQEAVFPEQRGNADAVSSKFYVPNRFARLHS